MITDLVPFSTWGKMEVLRKREMFACSLLVSSLLAESRVIHAKGHTLWFFFFFPLPPPPTFYLIFKNLFIDS